MSPIFYLKVCEWLIEQGRLPASAWKGALAQAALLQSAREGGGSGNGS
jgi:hypothetical protein